MFTLFCLTGLFPWCIEPSNFDKLPTKPSEILETMDEILRPKPVETPIHDLSSNPKAELVIITSGKQVYMKDLSGSGLRIPKTLQFGSEEKKVRFSYFGTLWDTWGHFGTLTKKFSPKKIFLKFSPKKI